MISPEDLLGMGREELSLLVSRLIADHQRLVAENQRMLAENQRMAAEIAKLRRRIEELERGGNRPAAPFSKNRRKPNPKRPGRKPGEGEFRYPGGAHAHPAAGRGGPGF